MYTILMLGVNNAINKTLRVCTGVETFKTSLLNVLKVQLFFCNWYNISNKPLYAVCWLQSEGDI